MGISTPKFWARVRGSAINPVDAGLPYSAINPVDVAAARVHDTATLSVAEFLAPQAGSRSAFLGSEKHHAMSFWHPWFNKVIQLNKIIFRLEISTL